MPEKITESATPVDIHVGKMIRAIRKAKGISQEKLAAAMGVSFQQVQKYENGANRISASKMFAAGAFLEVPPAAFFEGLEGTSTVGLTPELLDFLAEDGAAEIAAGYVKLNASQRRAVAAVIIGMGQ
jgi:transcriptional regulator with XRE-family HTH domain